LRWLLWGNCGNYWANEDLMQVGRALSKLMSSGNHDFKLSIDLTEINLEY
jgi:hypothetical protein